MANTKATILFNGSVYRLTQEYLDSLETKTCKNNDKTWTKEQIKDLLKEKDRFVISCLLKLYQSQTVEEQFKNVTISHNGIGFNSCDSVILSDIASQCYEKHFITVKQLSIVRRKILKYSKQILNMI